MIAAPDPIGIRTNINPRFYIVVLGITAIKEVALPGGWSVFVKFMKNMEIDTAKGACNHIRSLFPKHFFIDTPTNAEIMWPKRQLRGYAKSEETAEYNSTAVAPKLAVRRMSSEFPSLS